MSSPVPLEEPLPADPRPELAAHRVALCLIGGTTIVLVGLTVHRYGFTTNGCAWAAAQLLLGYIAAWDVITRRILNVVLLPASVLALCLRAAFVQSALLECVVAGVLAFVVFVVLAAAFRGGLGMGDVKLAGFIGLLLGSAAGEALIAGCIAGGVAAAALVVSGRAGRTSTFAYGPYLALGAALTILVGSPPPLY
jgi:leader peptidase (prepilin peptidase)/N-methyltransferase